MSEKENQNNQNPEEEENTPENAIRKLLGRNSKEPEESCWIIQNLTCKRLKIYGRDNNILVLAPLVKNLKLSIKNLEPFNLQPLVLQNLIRVDAEVEVKRFETPDALVGVVIWLIILYAIGGSIFQNYRPDLNMYFWIGVPILIVFFLITYSIFVSKKRPVIMRLIAQFLSLLLIMAIGIGLPIVAVYFFGGGREFFNTGEVSLAVFGRSLQIIFIVTASLLPALLFFLFDRQQLGTLKDRFLQQIFRLDPNIESLVDVEAKYGKQLAEIYGSDVTTDEGRLIRANRSPIFVATLVITIGWILTLLPAEAGLVIKQPHEILDLFLPQRMAVTFGFLGAYFFALNTISRRYMRADLKPKAYSSITVRIFIVTILAWVVGLLFNSEDPYVMVTVFLIGIFPESGLTLIQETIRRGSKIFPSAKEDHPLTNLEEIDVYDRARLLDEGVTNIESLAHHDMIDLMLETRIPLPRLVDWIDQAILYLHLPRYDEKKGDGNDGNNGDGNAQRNEASISFRWLQRHGIRTTTDLITAYDTGALRKILGENKEKLNQLEVLLDVIRDDEWLNYIERWREKAKTEDLIIPFENGAAGTLPTSGSIAPGMLPLPAGPDKSHSKKTGRRQKPKQ